MDLLDRLDSARMHGKIHEMEIGRGDAHGTYLTGTGRDLQGLDGDDLAVKFRVPEPVRVALDELAGPVTTALAGDYLGNLSANPYATNSTANPHDPDSISNPYGRYGNPYLPDSINNPYGAGNPYRHDAPTNPYGSGWRTIGDDGR